MAPLDHREDRGGQDNQLRPRGLPGGYEHDRYAKVAEKVNTNSMDFYAYMATAFLEDKDSRKQGAEKPARYYEYVVM